MKKSCPKSLVRIESNFAYIESSFAYLFMSKALIFLVVIGLLSDKSVFAQALKFEPNFVDFPLLAAEICSETEAKNTKPYHIAQVYAQKYRLDPSASNKKKSDLNKQLETSAKNLARKHRHHFYSFGICTPDSVWFASFPISADIIVSEHSIKLPWQQLDKFCHKVSYSMSDEHFAKIENVNLLSNEVISIDKTKKNVSIGISCLPSYVENTGPLLLYLYNANNEATFPFQEMFVDEKNLNTNPELMFIKWVNAIRSRYKIREIHTNAILTKMINPLAKAETSTHFREDTSKLFQSAQKQRLKLIGENRAVGNSIQQIAQYFWTSPSHRALLLDSQADYLAFACQVSETSTKLGVVVTAKSVK